MKRLALSLCLLASAAGAASAAEEALSPRAKLWWEDISALASDANEGRLTGSPGYMRAADYVISRFKAEGLAPAGDNGGYLQSVAFEQQTIDQAASTAVLTISGKSTPVTVGETAIFAAGGGPRPDAVDAPLVFIGYGLHLPAQGYDDFKGVDLKGKIAVVISGGPADLSGPVKSAARNARTALLTKAGAVGLISLTTPKQVEIPWARQKLIAHQPGMYLDAPGFSDTPKGFFTGTWDPANSEMLFSGSGHSFADLCALADASKGLTAFDLPARLKATVAAKREKLTSPNLIAKLEGSDPKLKSEYVAVSAHLDHLGVGEPIAGDKIYNGAMDDASGVAAVLDIAHVLKAGPRPKRTMLFVIVTAEEKGLLGSHYFAEKPTVPKGSIVADLNFDMPLPLWKLEYVFPVGDSESTLGAVSRKVAAAQGLKISPDPLPDRNVFTRTDQFSFVKAGIPALAFKFGFFKDTPQFQIEHDWRANRYHAPSDDLQQPGVMKEEAVKLDTYVAAIAAEIGNDPKKPDWLPTSTFGKPAPL
jgi:Zn-dependent M28 family amino/carboxypeptidase